MPKMMKDDDPKAYIEVFERHALMTGLPQDYWASQLGALVVGAAQAAYWAILREEAQDYEQVKQAILYRLEISPNHYRRLFWARKGPDERWPRVLLQLLRDLLNKWVNPVGSDREDLADQTDASKTAVGAVLMQEEEGIERPIVYASRKLSSAERRYATIEWECLAIRWAVDHFWYFLMGLEFKLVTDHAPLRWLSTARTDNAWITRWALALQPYKFQIMFRPGKSNTVADFLSRCDSKNSSEQMEPQTDRADNSSGITRKACGTGLFRTIIELEDTKMMKIDKGLVQRVPAHVHHPEEGHDGLKKGDLTNPGNWRPIGLCSTIAKLYTSCLAACITNWAVTAGAISQSQKGFISMEGCYEHNFTLQMALDKAWRTRKQCAVAWLNISNMFWLCAPLPYLQHPPQAEPTGWRHRPGARALPGMHHNHPHH
ncbi:hypothetical protein Y1Q_0022061 [Alligator mississippiensis]|uniref:Reverse transcriptase RNase H-like domain-containing protein n=1 Tax=Alligator mississippiensis TaxID=8496 RepID=A0A151NLS9_ALLMI|nr:hypothetical protein Y1Q_0022061 [Alligator mississippiensis]